MKKIAYISFNMAEYEALMSRASFAEITMYFALKKLANFKTGEVGSYRQQKLNYERLAQLVSRPPRNTAPAETYDRNQARAMVLRLEKIGLVSNIKIEGEALKMRLHLSPMFDLEDEALETAPALDQPVKAHQQEASNAVESPANAGDAEFDSFAISTDLVQYKQYHHHSHTDSTASNDDTDTGEGTSPSVAAGGNIHPYPKAKKPEGMSAELTVEVAMHVLAARGFRLLENPVSQTILRTWLKMGLTLRELEAAVFGHVAEGGDLVPGELDKVIRQMRKKSKAGTGRGSVAL